MTGQAESGKLPAAARPGAGRSQPGRKTAAPAPGGRVLPLPPGAGLQVAKTTATAATRRPSPLTQDNLGFLLAKASQRWNELLGERFAAAGFADVRPSYGSILVPLYQEDGLRMGEIARRARLSKQTITTMIRLLERDGLVQRRPDPEDGRAALVFLTHRAQAFRPIAETTLRELTHLAKQRLGTATTDALIAALRQLAELE